MPPIRCALAAQKRLRHHDDLPVSAWHPLPAILLHPFGLESGLLLYLWVARYLVGVEAIPELGTLLFLFLYKAPRLGAAYQHNSSAQDFTSPCPSPCVSRPGVNLSGTPHRAKYSSASGSNLSGSYFHSFTCVPGRCPVWGAKFLIPASPRYS
jgi:hypothetical protein